MKEFVDYIVKNLVDFPDSVTIETSEEGKNVRIEIHVSPEDAGKVIGRRGATINSLRTIVQAISARIGVRVDVQVIQPKEEEETPPPIEEVAEEAVEEVAEEEPSPALA